MEMLGRGDELADVLARLRERRLVTLTGPGGIGKTVLADAAARVAGTRFPKGSVRVDLTRVDQAEGVFEAVAAQLGYADYDSLMGSPGDQPVLVVLDNCEHVLDAAAEATASLLAACRMPSVLATSRSPLDLPDESIVTLGPLPTPAGDVDDGAPALRLLLERARDQGVTVQETDLPALAAVCRQVDGVPLALELAAARLRVLAPTELVRELEDHLHALARRTFRGRVTHRSVGDVVAWSCDLLGAEERAFFARLGVFAGPFTAAMAHDVAGRADPARSRELLEALVAASLVTTEPAPSPGATWYRLLHPVRAVARERLEHGGEAAEVRSRFVDLVVERVREVSAREAAVWPPGALGDLLALYDNVAASLRWTLAHDAGPRRSLLLLASLWGPAHQAHTAEVCALGESVLARWDDPGTELWPDAAATVATSRYLLGRGDEADALAVAALPHAGASRFAPASLLRVLALSARARGETEQAAGLLERAAAAAEATGAHGLAMEIRVAHALVLTELGDVEAGLDALGSVHAEATRTGSGVNRAWAAAARAAVLVDMVRGETVRGETVRGDDQAVAAAGRALEEARTARHAPAVVLALRSRARARLAAGDLPGAATDAAALVDELLVAGGLLDLRLALDVAAEVLERAHDPAWADLAATAAALPVTSVATPVRAAVLERARAAGGAVLEVRDAYRTSIDALRAVVGQGPEPTHGQVPGPGGVRTEGPPRFVREGEVWRLEYAGRTARLADAKGIADLATLVAAPGREVSALDLAGARVVGGTRDELVDATARRRYEQRIRELQAEVEDAEDAHDTGRSERARVELDALVDHLTAALGLGGRARRTTGEAERARSAVTQRVRAAIRRIGEQHPELGAHLRASVTTGTFCSYRP